MPYTPEHPQVPFITLNGKPTEVDADLAELLSLLKFMKVETHYSCQGSRLDQSYILATRRSSRRFERVIRRGLRKGIYTGPTTTILEHFVKGRHTQEFIWFHRNPLKAMYTFIIGNKAPVGFRRERTISNVYGNRTTYRWPSKFNEDVTRAILEVYIKDV